MSRLLRERQTDSLTRVAELLPTVLDPSPLRSAEGVRYEPGGEVSLLFQNETGGLTSFLRITTTVAGGGSRQLPWSDAILMKMTRGEGACLVDVSILDWIQSDVDLRF